MFCVGIVHFRSILFAGSMRRRIYPRRNGAPVGKLPLRDSDGDLVIGLPQYFPFVRDERRESPPNRSLAYADSPDASPGSKDGRESGMGVHVVKQEARALLEGHRNMMNDLERVGETQVATGGCNCDSIEDRRRINRCTCTSSNHGCGKSSNDHGYDTPSGGN